MAHSVPLLRALPLLVLGGGIFVLLAVTDVPPRGNAAVQERIDIGALRASAAARGTDPSACADSALPDCVIDLPASLIAAGP